MTSITRNSELNSVVASLLAPTVVSQISKPSASALLTQQDGGVCAHLQGDALPAQELAMNLRFAHVARRELDFGIALEADAAGRCAGAATDSGLQSRSYWAHGATIPRGQWSASLAAQDWRLARRLGPVDGQVLEIDSQAER